MPPDLLRAIVDPTAPLPALWPTGAWGAFLLFLVPVGGGIPVGVLMARNAGLSPLVTAFLYFLSDVILALSTEPLLFLIHRLSRRVSFWGRVGDRLSRLSQKVGLSGEGIQGPLRLILVSFAVSLTTGRAAAAAAGHGFVLGWSFAIVGDMLYFAVLMASTLWLSGVIGDDRLTVGIVLIASLLLPTLLRRWRSPRQIPPPTTPTGSPAPPPPGGLTEHWSHRTRRRK